MLMTSGFGVITGLTISITSIGAGSFLMPFLIFVFASRIRLNRLVGTDVAVGAAVGLVATTIYLLSGTVQIGPLVWLMLGSVPGVLIGSRTNFKLDTNGTRAAVSSVTMIVAAVMIYGGLVNG